MGKAAQIRYRPGGHIRYKPPPPGLGPRRGSAQNPTQAAQVPFKALPTGPPPHIAQHIHPPLESPPRANAPQNYGQTTRSGHPTPVRQAAEPIRNTTRPEAMKPQSASNATGSNETATCAAAERNGENITSAEHADREDDQTACASRPTETTEVGNRQPRCPGWLRCFGWLICLGWLRCPRCPRCLEASVGLDAPVPYQKHHTTKIL